VVDDLQLAEAFGRLETGLREAAEVKKTSILKTAIGWPPVGHCSAASSSFPDLSNGGELI
jgi:hypothetical protein